MNIIQCRARLTPASTPRIRNAWRAALLLAVTLLLSCPDAGNGDATPSEATRVKNVRNGAISANSIILYWDTPTDIHGYVGTTISEASNAGSLSIPAEIDASLTTYTVTELDSANEYRFTITTRYADSGKDNSVTIMAMTALSTEVQNIAIDQSKLTSDSIALIWQNPQDAEHYTGVTISADTAIGSLSTSQTVLDGTNILVISGLTAETFYTATLTFTTQYSDGKSGSSEHMMAISTQSNRVRAVIPSTITTTTITLTWEDAEDTIHYSGVRISADPAEGSLSTAKMIHATAGRTAQQIVITGLTVGQEYTITIATQYDGGKVAGADVTIMVASLLVVDADGDSWIDIDSLERLYNVRYNLDLSDGRYKSSADDVGTQCGTAADTPCSGYELTRDLDFTDSGSYQSGEINTAWRPNTMADHSGTMLSQDNAAMATNPGWDPIGSCNGDTADYGIGICDDSDDTPLVAPFTGNGYTISNLYARNTDANNALAIGLFGSIALYTTVHNIGMVNAFVHGSSAIADHVGTLAGFNNGSISSSYAIGSTTDGGMGMLDLVGGLVGHNGGGYGLVGWDGGTISASYVSGATVNGGMGNDDEVGGLVGRSSGANSIIANHVDDSTVNGGMGNYDYVGGLVGWNNTIIIASYVDNSTVDGGMGNYDAVGGLVGRNSHIIIASYVSGGTVSGGADDNDDVGGLVGNNSFNGNKIIISYATSDADGGTGSGDHVGSLVGRNTAFLPFGLIYSGTITASYAFGSVTNVDIAGESGTDHPSGVTAVAELTAPGTATATAVAPRWNGRSAWYFGTAGQAPILQYADYDGAGREYGCGGTTGRSAAIPSIVPDGVGGTTTVVCGTTLLPRQNR